MNDQTAALLQQLANKLGTTSEYLWGVLVRQAPIQAWIMAFEYGMTLLAIIVLWRVRKPLGAWLKKSMDDDAGPAVFIGSVVFVIVASIWLVACVFCFEDMITAFLNPEYWALNKVLSLVKSK